MVHSDRGSQFRSHAYLRALRAARPHGSIGRVGARADNARALLDKAISSASNRRAWRGAKESPSRVATVCGVDLHRAFDPIDRLRGVVHILWRELAKFGVVGAAAFIIDFGGFNLLFYGPLSGHLSTSKVASGGLATLFAWAGNRLWTFRHRRNRPVHHEAMLFFAVNGLGLLLSTGYLNATHDLRARVFCTISTLP